jgi:hypothetical protein
VNVKADRGCGLCDNPAPNFGDSILYFKIFGGDKSIAHAKKETSVWAKDKKFFIFLGGENSIDQVFIIRRHELFTKEIHQVTACP